MRTKTDQESCLSIKGTGSFDIWLYGLFLMTHVNFDDSDFLIMSVS